MDTTDVFTTMGGVNWNMPMFSSECLHPVTNGMDEPTPRLGHEALRYEEIEALLDPVNGQANQ